MKYANKVSICDNVFSVCDIDRVSPVDKISDFDIGHFGYSKGFSFTIRFYTESTNRDSLSLRFPTKEEADKSKARIESLMNIVKL
jgi:hypothetical protein